MLPDTKRPEAVFLSLVLRLVLTGLVWTSAGELHAQSDTGFELHRGDRVTFVGDGFVEHAQRYGYIEMAFTTRWPNRGVTFRNVGWSGDTVFGEARDHYTNPPTAYEHLIEQVESSKPDVVFFGYGGTLAYEDADGVTSFATGYHQLLDTLGVAPGRCVLLSPIPHDPSTSPNRSVALLNEKLLQGRNVIEEIATAQGCFFVDLFTPLMRRLKESPGSTTSDGVHLNDIGYRTVASVIETVLSESPRPDTVELNVASGYLNGGVLQGNVEQKDGSFQFVLMPTRLPASVGQGRTFRFSGLRNGTYSLVADDVVVARARAAEWTDGVIVVFPDEDESLKALRQLLVRKNELYFRQYRPLNETYLVGFRRYEQGQNAGELAQLDALIDEIENEIGRLSMPRSLSLKLIRQ